MGIGDHGFTSVDHVWSGNFGMCCIWQYLGQSHIYFLISLQYPGQNAFNNSLYLDAILHTESHHVWL